MQQLSIDEMLKLNGGIPPLLVIPISAFAYAVTGLATTIGGTAAAMTFAAYISRKLNNKPTQTL